MLIQVTIAPSNEMTRYFKNFYKIMSREIGDTKCMNFRIYLFEYMHIKYAIHPWINIIFVTTRRVARIITNN